MSEEFKIIEVKEFIIERLSKRKAIDSNVDIKKATNSIIDYDEEFIAYVDFNMLDYCNDEEVDYIIDKTGYEYEFIELVLWQKYIYEMNEGLWEYDVESCIKCNGDNLKFKEVEGVDFADKIVCEKCNCEMIIGKNGLEIL